MKLFGKGKGDAAGEASQAPSFQAIDRVALLGFLDQLVNGGQSGVLQLEEARGSWTYAFQAGALTHASGGRVRGARQAFDLLWEFQSGQFQFSPGTNPALAGNLYIDKARLLDLLRRSQAALQGPASPYIAPDQQRPIQPVQQSYSPPAPGQTPGWQPPAQPGQQQQPQWQPAAQPGQAGQPAWGNGPYAPPPAGYPAPPQPAPYPGQMAAAAPPAQFAPGQPPQMTPPAPPAPARAATPPSFSVPPMAIPRRKEPAPVYQPPVAPAAAIVPMPEVRKPAPPVPPKDDLQSLRASLAAEAPASRPAPVAPSWGVRSTDGDASAVPLPVRGKGKAKGKDVVQNAAGRGDRKVKSKLRAALDVRLITFLLWACERKYSPDDHWTLKDAFEVSTMELRDQFIGAFSQSFKASSKRTTEDDDVDQMAAGRMRGRGRKR